MQLITRSVLFFTVFVLLPGVLFAPAACRSAENPSGILSDITLTDREVSWLKGHPVIRVAPDPDFPPVDFFDQNEIYKGIAAISIPSWIRPLP